MDVAVAEAELQRILSSTSPAKSSSKRQHTASSALAIAAEAAQGKEGLAAPGALTKTSKKIVTTKPAKPTATTTSKKTKKNEKQEGKPIGRLEQGTASSDAKRVKQSPHDLHRRPGAVRSSVSPRKLHIGQDGGTKVHLRRTGSVDISVQDGKAIRMLDGLGSPVRDDFLRSDPFGAGALGFGLGAGASSPAATMPSFMSHPLSAHKDKELSAIAREIDGLRMSGFGANTTQTATYGGTSNAASSAAVIHALRALQEKVHKLELEREQAGAQCGQLQQELDSYKMETEREKAEKLALIDELRGEIHLLRQKVHIGKQDIELKLAKEEEKCNALERELDYVKQRAQSLDVERREQLQRTESAIKDAREARQECETAKGELFAIRASSSSTGLESNMALKEAEAALEESERELQAERTLRQELEVKQFRTEEFLRNILAINENLVQRVAHPEAIVHAGSGSASSSSASSTRRGRGWERKVKRKPKKAIVKRRGGDGGGRVKLRGSKVTRMRKRGAKKRPGSGWNPPNKDLKHQVESANLNKQVPFVAGGSTGPSYSIYRTVQPQLAHPEAYGFSPPKPSISAIGRGSRSSPSSSATDTADDAGDIGREEQKKADYAAARDAIGSKGRAAARSALVGAEALKETGNLSAPTATAVRSTLGPLSSSRFGGEESSSSAAASLADSRRMSKKELESATSAALSSARQELEYSRTHNGYAPVPGPFAGQRAAHEMSVDMRAILHSLEDEYKELNLEYQEIIKGAVGEANTPGAQITNIAMNTKISELIEKIENKGQQIYLLKRFKKLTVDMRGRSPLRNPLAAEKKIRALRALHDLREGRSEED